MITEFRWLRHGETVPDGWAVEPIREMTHHHHYARLISRQIDDEPAQQPLPAPAD